jgi:hypothetical protein
MSKESTQFGVFVSMGHSLSGNHLHKGRIDSLMRAGARARYEDGVLSFVLPNGALALIDTHGMRHQEVRAVRVPILKRLSAPGWVKEYNERMVAEVKATAARAQAYRQAAS